MEGQSLFIIALGKGLLESVSIKREVFGILSLIGKIMETLLREK
jgi:hypothetical protein